MRPLFFTLPTALAFLATVAGAAPSNVSNVTVKGSRVHLGDLVIGLADDVASADLGPTPSGTGTRIVTREELERALHEHGIDGSKSLPEAVRVHRKLRSLNRDDVARIVTENLEGKLPRGVSLRDVRPLNATTIPDGYTEVRCDLPRHRTARARSLPTSRWPSSRTAALFGPSWSPLTSRSRRRRPRTTSRVART